MSDFVETTKILVIGANSGIARGIIDQLAPKKCSFFLVARDEEKLAKYINTLKQRGVEKISSVCFDFNQFQRSEEVVKHVITELNGLDVVFMAHGSYPDQIQCQNEFALTLDCINTNYISGVSWLTPIANYFESQRRGSIVVVTSPAGDRGRKKHYVYGSAKSGMSIYLEGLRSRLFRVGVHVLTVKPGFVATDMTAFMKKNIFFSKPDNIAKGILKALLRKKDVIYLPRYWSWILYVIKRLPDSLLKRIGF